MSTLQRAWRNVSAPNGWRSWSRRQPSLLSCRAGERGGGCAPARARLRSRLAGQARTSRCAPAVRAETPARKGVEDFPRSNKASKLLEDLDPPGGSRGRSTAPVPKPPRGQRSQTRRREKKTRHRGGGLIETESERSATTEESAARLLRPPPEAARRDAPTPRAARCPRAESPPCVLLCRAATDEDPALALWSTWQGAPTKRAHASVRNVRVRSHAGSSWSAAKSVQWTTAVGVRTGKIASRKRIPSGPPPPSAPSSSAAAPSTRSPSRFRLGRGASTRSNVSPRRVARRQVVEDVGADHFDAVGRRVALAPPERLDGARQAPRRDGVHLDTSDFGTRRRRCNNERLGAAPREQAQHALVARDGARHARAPWPGAA